LGVAFTINLFLRFAKDAVDNSDGESATEEGFIRFLSILTSLFVAAVNVALGRIVRFLSAYEKHNTHSKYHLSVAVKLTICMFINTGINPMFVNFGRWNWFDSGGLMVDIFYNSIAISFISPLFYLFDPVYLSKKLKI